jgi:hypothetical protein
MHVREASKVASLSVHDCLPSFFSLGVSKLYSHHNETNADPFSALIKSTTVEPLLDITKPASQGPIQTKVAPISLRGGHKWRSSRLQF